MIYSKEEMGKLIKSLRQERKPRLTRESLAEKVGVTAPTIYRWEIGKFYPELDKLDSLADALGVGPAKILGLSTEQESNDTRSEMAKMILSQAEEFETIKERNIQLEQELEDLKRKKDFYEKSYHELMMILNVAKDALLMSANLVEGPSKEQLRGLARSMGSAGQASPSQPQDALPLKIQNKKR